LPSQVSALRPSRFEKHHQLCDEFRLSNNDSIAYVATGRKFNRLSASIVAVGPSGKRRLPFSNPG
jgi:hypothetical protein